MSYLGEVNEIVKKNIAPGMVDMLFKTSPFLAMVARHTRIEEVYERAAEFGYKSPYRNRWGQKP